MSAPFRVVLLALAAVALFVAWRTDDLGVLAIAFVLAWWMATARDAGAA